MLSQQHMQELQQRYSPNFKLMLLYMCMCKQLLQKDVQNLEKQKEKQLSGYRQCYAYKNQSLEVFRYMNSAFVTCNKFNLSG